MLTVHAMGGGWVANTARDVMPFQLKSCEKKTRQRKGSSFVTETISHNTVGQFESVYKKGFIVYNSLITTCILLMLSYTGH